jgi:malonyl-ACP decarboxylase
MNGSASINLDITKIPPLITGMGAVTSIGNSVAEISVSLRDGKAAFAYLQREGRCYEEAFIGAELGSLTLPEWVEERDQNSISFTAKAALVAMNEAWSDADLDQVDPARIGLIVGGSNVQQRYLNNLREKRRETPYFIQPSYALNFMDSDICGICTEMYGIRGMSYTLGAASASGQMAAIQAAQSVMSGAVDVCIVIGALADLSYWECYAFTSLGAMGSAKFADSPTSACRPFDQQRDGFIFGEACGVLVIERHEHALNRGVNVRGVMNGWSVAMDANRNPDPSLEGEITVINQALDQSGIKASQIDYVNPHGSGSILGDNTELTALAECGLNEAAINTTKSLVGHTITAAGCIEIISTLIQMEQGFLHPCLNLDSPVRDDFNWVRNTVQSTDIKQALNLSYGFGGVNTALCISRA